MAAQWRGVFIAPSTINHRAHHRSKSQPDLSPSHYKSEYSHYPRRGSFGTLSSQAVPSLPRLSKVINIEFRQKKKERVKKTSRYAILCNPDILKPGEKEQLKNISPSCNARGDIPERDKPRKSRNVKEEPSAEEEDTTDGHCAPLTKTNSFPKSHSNPGAPVNSLLGTSTSFVPDSDKHPDTSSAKEKERAKRRVQLKAGEIPVTEEPILGEIDHSEGLVRLLISNEPLRHREGVDNDSIARELIPAKTVVEDKKDSVRGPKACDHFPESKHIEQKNEIFQPLESEVKVKDIAGPNPKDLEDEFESTPQLAENTKTEKLELEEGSWLENQDPEEDLSLDINQNRIGKKNKNNIRTKPDNSIDRKLNLETGKAIVDEKKLGEEKYENKVKGDEIQTLRPNAVKDKSRKRKREEKEPIFEESKGHSNTPKLVRENSVNCSLQELLETPRGDVEKVENEGLKRRLFSEDPDSRDVSNCEKDVPSHNQIPQKFLDLNSEKEEDKEDENEENKMASQSVKANKELWESRETIRKLKDNLLSEQKISESKERTIQNLKKEMKSLEKDLKERKDESEALDEANAKVLSIETDNRILANQVKMVEEANKKLYKELHEAKTKLRSHEGKCEDVTTQNAQLNRRASQILQSSLDNCTGFTIFIHQMETEMISTEAALRKLKAQRQALEDLLKEDHEKPKCAKFPFSPAEKPRVLDEQVKKLIRAQLEESPNLQFEDESSKRLHYDERMKDLENIMSDCLKKHLKSEAETLFVKQKKLDLARAHVKALKQIEDKFVDMKNKTEGLITSKKDAISKEVKELSNELSVVQLEKRHGKQPTAHRNARKISNPDQSPRAIRKNSIEEISDIDRAIRSIRSKSEEKNEDLSENEKEILCLNEKMSKALEDKVHLSEELMELQTNIEVLENKYEQKQKETERMEKELSGKRQEIMDMATNMEQALKELQQNQRTDNSTGFGEEASSPQNKGKFPPENSDKEDEVNIIKEELVQTILLLKNEQTERQEALKMNDDLFMELENREQEISKLVLELEHYKEKERQESVERRPRKMLSELWSSIHETNKTKDETDHLHKELEQELIFKDKEFEKLEKKLDKMAEEFEKQEMLLEYYKDEVMKLQQEREKRNQLDALEDRNKELEKDDDMVAKLQSGIFVRDKEIQKLEDDVEDIKGILEKEIQSSENYKRKASELEDVVRKETQAKEYAYKRNKELEDELQLKNTKLNNLASAVKSKNPAEPESNEKQSKTDSSTTIAQLRETMQQIQDEKQKLAAEVDILAFVLEDEGGESVEPEKIDSEESGTIEPHKNAKDDGTEEEKRPVEQEVSKERNRTTEEEATSKEADAEDKYKAKEGIPVEQEIHVETVDAVLAQEDELFAEKPLDECDAGAHGIDSTTGKKSGKKFTEDISEDDEATPQDHEKKNKIIKELKDIIEHLEQELKQSRSENILLENEAADIMDDGCLKNENRSLRHQVNDLSIELSIARADEHDLQQELNISESKTRDLEDSIERLEALRDELHAANQELFSAKELLEQELKLLKKKVHILEDETKLLKDEIMKLKDLQDSVEKLETLREELHFANDELRSEKELLEQELELMKKKIDILEDETNLLQEERKELDLVGNKTFLEENETLKTEISKITLQLEVNKENLELLQGELQASQTNVKELQAKLHKLHKEKTGLEMQVDDLSFQNKIQEKETNLLKKKVAVYEDEIKLVEQELTRKSEELREKEEVLQKLLQDNEFKEHEKEKLEHELKDHEETNNAEDNQLQRVFEKNLGLRSQIKKLKMDSAESKHEQRRLERDLNELRDRLREADRKFSSTKDDKSRTEDELGVAKKRIGFLEKELNEAKLDIKAKNETIRKLNQKNSELQAVLLEREEERRREERLRMENMKVLDALKIKTEKMENDDKKQKERLFSLKSACSEANEAYEIVKKQNLHLRNDMQELKKKLASRDVEVDTNRREKEKLEEQILNASRTIDDIRKYSARDESLSPDSALGISISSLTDVGSGPNSPNSDISDTLFVPGDEEMKFAPRNPQGLLCKMPTMIENFRAVVRENEVMKSRLIEMLNNKEKMNSQLQYYSGLNDDLQKDVGEKEKLVIALQNQTSDLEEALNDSKNKFEKIERDFTATATEADLIKTTLQVREETVSELREKVELLEEKEKALELYSKSMAEKYKNEAAEKEEVKNMNDSLHDKTEEQQQLLKKLEQKLSEYSSKSRRVSEAEVKAFEAPVVEKAKRSDVAMVTLEGKLDDIMNYSEALENSLTDVEMGYHRLQAENERLLREMVKKEDYQELETKLQEQEMSFQEQVQDREQQISELEKQKQDLEKENKENEDAIANLTDREKELIDESRELKKSFTPLQQANDMLKAEIEALKESIKQNEENRVRIETELKSTKTKMCEMEMTSEAYREENDRLRNDVISLSEEKCEVECKVSEAERREKKLNELLDQERAQQKELQAEHESALSICDSLQNDLSKAKDNISTLEAEQDRTQKAKNEMETKLMDLSSQNNNVQDELNAAKKDLNELEERYKKAVDAEESLNQKLSKSSMENARLSTAYDQSQRRRNEAERGILEATAKNEDFSTELERVRIEKATLLKEIAQKEETIEGMEAKKSELEQEAQKLTNELYLSTRKVLSLQLNLESLRNEVSQMGKDLRRLVLGTIGREPRDEAEEKSMEADLELNLFENEVVVQALRQAIKSTEKSLDQIRPDAMVSEVENKNCQKDIDCVHREFAYLKDQLNSFKHSCQKLSDETKRLKEDVKNKEALLQDAREQYEALKEENGENQERISSLQAKCTDLEALSAEYEENAETTHNELVQANQQIASLESSIAKLEQKKNTLEKERLVLQERINNLEANQRASKDESRNDKKRIASLEVEYNEKKGLARDLETVEGSLAELRMKYDDVVKDREETKAELAAVKEEMRQQGMELKNSKKDAENFKKHIVIEREMRMRVEQDLNEQVEELKTTKKSLNALQRAHEKMEEEKELLEEKAKLLEETGQTLKKELEVQGVESKRLRDSLTDTRNELQSTTLRCDNSEREKKKLMEELIHAEEQVKKLQETCKELLNEKGSATDKVTSLNEALESMIRSHDDTIDHLKQDLMNAKKDLSVTKSSLERSQKRNEGLQNEIKNQEDKIKAGEEKKQELFEKFWDSQNQLGEAESAIDNLETEIKELKGRIANYLNKIEQLEEISQREREENEKAVENFNEKISALKTQNQKLLQETDNLKAALEESTDALKNTSEELQQTSSALAVKEKDSTDEIDKLENAVDHLRKVSEDQRLDLRRTKDALKDANRENKDLKERLNTTEEKLEGLESKVKEQENDNVDALAEAQAKLNVVSKMKASNSGERFAEMQCSTLLASPDDDDDFDRVDSASETGLGSSIKDVVDAFHQACMSSFSDNRSLQESLAQANEDNTKLEEALQKDRNNMAEMKRYLQETEKKKTKLEEEGKRLRRRLENLKQKAIEMERSKDDELCELKGEKIILEKEHWQLKEEFEELKAKTKETEEDRDRYAEDLNNTRVQVVEARNDIKKAQEHLDNMQEKQLETKKKIFELEAREKGLQQQIHDKEKELCTSQAKSDELEKLYENANQKKTELFSQVSKAEDKIGSLEKQLQENQDKQKELREEVESLSSKVSELEQSLEETTSDLNVTKEKNEELDIQRGSLLASNEILKHQVEVSRGEYETLKESYDKVHDDTVTLSTDLNQKTIEKENLETELKCLAQEKDRLQESLNTSETQLRESEDNLVKSFQETENLKRQMLKVQSTACAESAKHQGEAGKMKSELESTKKELAEKESDYTEKVAKLKAIEKDSESLKKELNELRMRESELKLDYTSANSKLQSYVLERECWEREVKTVLNEIEHQKSANTAKEQRLDRLRMRYEQEIGFLSQRVSTLERELKMVQEAAEQQRHADEIAHKLSLEAKDMEIDNYKMRLQATRIHASDRNTVVDQMKNQLDERTAQINELMEQMKVLKDSYHLELASVQAELKCSQMENLLKLKKDMGNDNQITSSQESVSDLLEAIKASRKESERLRHLLGNKMKEMKNLKKHLVSERFPRGKPSSMPLYTKYDRDNEGHLSLE